MVCGKKCALVVLNYNDSENAIRFSASMKRYEAIDDILIIDNASTDDSYEKLSGIADDKIFVFSSGKNGGYGFGNNYGVKLAKTKFDCDIAFICNTDIVVPEECIEKLAHCLVEKEDAVICSALQINGYTQKPVKALAWKLPTTLTYIKNSLFWAKRIFSAAQYKYDAPIQKVDCVPGAFLAVNIDKFLESGGYDENMFLFCEEATLAARTQKKGYSTYILTDCKYEHYHSTSIKKSYPKSISRFCLVLDSRRYYLIHYRNVRGPLLFLVDAVFAFGVLERKIVFVMKRIYHAGKRLIQRR